MSKWTEASQNWAGMNGAEAWAMIDRHSDGWTDTERMMNAWLDANRAPEPSAELARLRAENEATRSALVDAAQKQKEEQSKMLAAVDRLRKESDALIAMHSALRAENERLKADAADAARYRWIKRGASFREERDMGPGGCWSIFVAVPRRPAVNSLDTAIDAAMAQGKV